MKIVVLAGGISPERDVSLSSGSLITNSLISLGYEVLLVDLYKGIDYDNIKFLKKEDNVKFEYNILESEPDLNKLKCNNLEFDLIGKNVLEVCKISDLVFIALHGDIGENGKIQSIFDIYNIKYTGTGYIGCLLAMDKDLTKKILVYNNILTPKWIVYENNIDTVINYIGFPCVVKPCSFGSSIGVSLVSNLNELMIALDTAQALDSKVLVEEMIIGREFSVGILNNKALPVIEILTTNGFYDYRNKYQIGMTTEICPANISNELTNKVQSIAIDIHKYLRLKDYSRIDFILRNNNFYCLEANTLPGMTKASLLPQEANAAGIDYDKLCDNIVKLALKI